MRFIVFAAFALCLVPAISLAAATHPLTCIGSDGARYVWSSPECAAARALYERQNANSAPHDSAPTNTADGTTAVGTALIPKGTLIVVAVRRSYKSYGASTGTKITYNVSQDVIVDGYLIAKQDDTAEGEILNAHEGTSNPWTGTTEGANLRISVDKVFTYCGDTIEMDFARSEFRNRQGLFGSKKDVEISKGQQYQVPTERSQKVCGTKTTAEPQPIPSGALAGDQN
jgi:hypothetical protein